MKIEVEIKNVYGKQAVYPVNREAKLFAELLGQSTFTLRDIGIIKKLGFSFESVKPIDELVNMICGK